MTTTTTEAFETGLRAEFEAWKRTQIDQDAWSAVLWATERAAKLCDRLGGDIDMRNPDDVKIAANSLAAASIGSGKESAS